MTTTKTEPTTTDECPSWCDVSSLFSGHRHTHSSDISSEIPLAFTQPQEGLAVTLIQEGSEQPRICIDLDEKPLVTLTLTETAQLAVWLLKLFGAAKPSAPLPPAPSTEEIMAQLRELDKETAGAVR
jgi:hypothetical protein